jgi:hypothetical protein
VLQARLAVDRDCHILTVVGGAAGEGIGAEVRSKRAEGLDGVKAASLEAGAAHM